MQVNNGKNTYTGAIVHLGTDDGLDWNVCKEIQELL